MYLTPIPGTTFYALVSEESVFPLRALEASRVSDEVPFVSWYSLTDDDQHRVYIAYMTSDLRASTIIGSK